MYLINGEYDYLTNPGEARSAAAGIGEGATAVVPRTVGDRRKRRNAAGRTGTRAATASG